MTIYLPKYGGKNVWCFFRRTMMTICTYARSIQFDLGPPLILMRLTLSTCHSPAKLPLYLYKSD